MGESLRDLVVLITGASSGIGAGCAVEFARNGSRLAIHGRNAERLEDTARRCQEVGLPRDKLLLLTGDVTKKDDCINLVETTVRHYGRLDVLFNNAGATRAKTIETCEIEDLDWVYDVLVRSVFMMTKAAIPHLEKTKGAIITTSSLAGLRPLNYALPYSMCKCMVDRFTQACSVSLGAKGIRINTVNPAAVMTDMFNKPGGPGGSTDKKQKYLDWCARAIPLGRIGEIQEVANLVTFLASKEAQFISGYNWPIDGSYSNTSCIPKPRKL